MHALLVLLLRDELERLETLAHTDVRVRAEGTTSNEEVLGAARALFELAAARVALDAAEFARARSWLASVRSFVDELTDRTTAADAGGAVADALFAIERAAESIASVRATRTSAPPPAPRSTLIVGRHGRWFRVEDGAAVSLRRRPTLARLLYVLAVTRQTSPGKRLSADDAVASAWPGERILPSSARNRLYFSIYALRRLGLRDAILSRDGGYYIPTHIDVRFEEELSQRRVE